LITASFRFGRVMVFLSLVVFGFITEPPTMIRLFAELSGHYLSGRQKRRFRAAHDLKPTGVSGANWPGEHRPSCLRPDHGAHPTLGGE